jgi:integrase
MASIQKRQGARGTAYRVQYRDQVGHQAVKTFHRLEDARRFRSQIENSRPDDILAGRVSLAQVLEDMRETVGTWSPATIRQQGVFVRALEQVDPDLFGIDVGKLTRGRLERAIGRIERPVMRRRCRVFVNQLLKQKGRPTIPSPDTKTRADRMAAQKRSERSLETSEVEAILQHIPARYRTMLTLMAYVGLRPGEAYGLQLQDFDAAACEISVRRAVSRGKVGLTKTGETRTLPIGGLGELLSGHSEEYGIREPEEQLFTNGQGRIIHENTFGAVFKRAVKAAGIANNVSPNSLRHHAAAWMIHRRANVIQVSKMLGHSKPSITLDVYAYLFSDSLDEVAAILPLEAREASAMIPTMVRKSASDEPEALAARQREHRLRERVQPREPVLANVDPWLVADEGLDAIDRVKAWIHTPTHLGKGRAAIQEELDTAAERLRRLAWGPDPEDP